MPFWDQLAMSKQKVCGSNCLCENVCMIHKYGNAPNARLSHLKLCFICGHRAQLLYNFF